MGTRAIIRVELALVLVLLALIVKLGLSRVTAVSGSNEPKYVAIVIDDFGNGSKGTEEMLSLPIKITGAVMPNMPNSPQEAKMLKDKGMGVILHQPMEAHTGQRSWLGPTPILADMSNEQVAETFKNGIDNVGIATGFNNHMGSKITEDESKMRTMLEIAKDRGMFFVDSVTTGKSVGGKIAEELGVPYVKRDVFLDSTQDINKIQQNIIKAGDIALEKGYAVAIGHVGAEGGLVTYNALMNTYKDLQDKGIVFVTVDELLEKISQNNGDTIDSTLS